MPYDSRTVGAMMLRLADQLGDLKHDNTTTGGTTSTAVDASMPWANNDDEGVIGAWFYGISGAGAGDERISISPYTASTGTLTYDRTGTNPGDTTGYIITRKHRPTFLLRCLQDAQRYQDQAGITGLKTTGHEILIGSAIPNNFDLFTTANVPDGLTIDTNSTFTMQTTDTLGGRRVLKMVTDGSNAGFMRYAIPGWGQWQGQSAKLYFHLRTSIAARTTTQISDGVTTATTKTSTTANDWELHSLSQAMGSAATQLQVSAEVSAGSAVTVEMALWDAPFPLGPPWDHPIDADRNITYIGDLRASAGRVSDTNPNTHAFPIEVGAFEIIEHASDTPRKLRLNGSSSLKGRVLEYKAFQRHAELTGPTVSFTGTDMLVLARAKYYALDRTEQPDVNGRRPLTAQAEQDMLVAELPKPRGLSTPVPASYAGVTSQ